MKVREADYRLVCKMMRGRYSIQETQQATGLSERTIRRIRQKEGITTRCKSGPKVGLTSWERPAFDERRFVRCPGCGGLVHPPCLACGLKRRIK